MLQFGPNRVEDPGGGSAPLPAMVKAEVEGSTASVGFLVWNMEVYTEKVLVIFPWNSPLVSSRTSLANFIM